MFLLGLLVVASSSLVIVLNGLRKAPEAYEDESGFHLIRKRAHYSGASVLPRRSSKRDIDGGRLDRPLPAGAGHLKG
jgi:hypothetical protein